MNNKKRQNCTKMKFQPLKNNLTKSTQQLSSVSSVKNKNNKRK